MNYEVTYIYDVTNIYNDVTIFVFNLIVALYFLIYKNVIFNFYIYKNVFFNI